MALSTLVDRWMASLSERELIGQTCQGLVGEILVRSGGDTAGYLEKFPYGSAFAGREISRGQRLVCSEVRRTLDTLQESSRVPLAIAGDLESGAGAAVSGLARFPSPMALAASATAHT